MADITEKDIENVKNYHYQNQGVTTIDDKLDPFWDKVESYFPYSFSPNMITITGLIFPLIMVLIFSLNDLTLSKPLSPIIYFLCSISLFFYQTFDAVDGKHARKTGRSSALGQVLDHGVDCFFNFIYPIFIGQTHLLGGSVMVIIFQIALQVPFYAYNVEEYYVGKMRVAGGTYFQFIIMILMALPGIFGHSFFIKSILGLQFISFLILLYRVMAFLDTVNIIQITSKSKEDGWQKWKSLILLYAFISFEILSEFLLINKKYRLIVVLLRGLYFGLFMFKTIITIKMRRIIPVVDLDFGVYGIGIIIALLCRNEYVEKIVFGCLFIWLIYRFYIKVISFFRKVMKDLKISF